MKNQVYDWVTERILALLDKGQVPWKKPWDAKDSRPMNFLSKKPYRGINYFLLNFSGYGCPYWLTLNQARTLGGKVKKGEKSSMVVFYKTLEYKSKDDPNKTDKIPLLRYYNVFNLEQIEGIEIPKTEEEEAKPFEPIEEAARIVREMPKRPNISHGGNRACYSVTNDSIQSPKPETFNSREEYYSTIFHELGHSTGHKDRLNRFDSTVTNSIFGSESYSKEELIAEMTSAFLCAMVGIENVTIENTAAYINGWRKMISSDTKLVVQAANAAQKAADFILNVKKEEKKDEAAE